MFSPFFFKQILKEFSFCFVILVPNSFKDLLNLFSLVIHGVYILGGGYGTCNIILNSVFAGIINGATTMQGGGVG